MKDTIRIFRVFKTKVQEVWSAPIPAVVADTLLTLGWPFSEVPPTIITKGGCPFLAKYLWDGMQVESMKPYQPIVDTIVRVIEAYPHSYHHAAGQEFGIALAINQSVYDRWPAWRWSLVTETGSISAGLTMEDLTAMKKNNRVKPTGLPINIWKGIKRC